MRLLWLPLLVLLALPSAFTAQAEPIQVLVSISKPSVSATFLRKLRKHLNRMGIPESEYQLTENADQNDLHQALTSNETRALIWVSHGAMARFSLKTRRKLKGTSGMSALPELIDYRGDNVAPIFKAQNDRLKFLAVIGCNSQEILNYVGSELGSAEGQASYIPSSKVIGQFAIRNAIRQLAVARNDEAWDHSEPSPANQAQPTDVLTLTRTIDSQSNPDSIRSLRVLMGETLLGVIPAPYPGQTITMKLPASGIPLTSIRLETGQPIMTDPSNIDFGTIEIHSSSGKKFNLFAKKDGTPFGLNFRLFLSP